LVAELMKSEAAVIGYLRGDRRPAGIRAATAGGLRTVNSEKPIEVVALDPVRATALAQRLDRGGLVAAVLGGPMTP
jgi:hypothetical protein